MTSPQYIDSDDPKKTRMNNAILKNMRRRENKDADALRDRGWAVLSPHWEPGDDGRPAPAWKLGKDEVITPEQVQQVIDDQQAAAEALRKWGWKVTKK